MGRTYCGVTVWSHKSALLSGMIGQSNEWTATKITMRVKKQYREYGDFRLETKWIHDSRFRPNAAGIH
jgi:hypothetical protein